MSEIKTEEKKAIRGGEFLVKETNPNEILFLKNGTKNSE